MGQRVKRTDNYGPTAVPPDYLVCGLCQRDFSLANMVLFIQHKKFDCDDFRDCQGTKTPILLCQSCPRKFTTPWRLMQHAQNVHSINIYFEQGDMGPTTHTYIRRTDSPMGDMSFIEEYLSPSKHESVLLDQHNYSVRSESSIHPITNMTPQNEANQINMRSQNNANQINMRLQNNANQINITPQNNANQINITPQKDTNQMTSQSQILNTSPTKGSEFHTVMNSINKNSQDFQRMSANRSALYQSTADIGNINGHTSLQSNSVGIANSHTNVQTNNIGMSNANTILQSNNVNVSNANVNFVQQRSLLKPAVVSNHQLNAESTALQHVNEIPEQTISSGLNLDNLALVSNVLPFVVNQNLDTIPRLPEALTQLKPDPLHQNIDPNTLKSDPTQILALDGNMEDVDFGGLLQENSHLNWVQSELEVKTNLETKADMKNKSMQKTASKDEGKEGDDKCCDNQDCGVTVMPVTHEELKKCCNAVVPKKRKRHMETTHRRMETKHVSTTGRVRRRSSTGDKYGRKTKTVYIDIDDSVDSPNSSPTKHHIDLQTGDFMSQLTDNSGAKQDLGYGSGPGNGDITTELVFNVGDVGHHINNNNLPNQSHSVIIQPGTTLSIPVSSSNTLPPISSYLSKANICDNTIDNNNMAALSKLDAHELNSVLGFLDLAHSVPAAGTGQKTGTTQIEQHSSVLDDGKLLIQLSTTEPLVNRSGTTHQGDEFEEVVLPEKNKLKRLIGREANYGISKQYLDGKGLRKRRYPTSKPFKCDKCNQAFNQRIHLKKHQSKHTGVKPFQCEQCDYSTVEKSHLKVHIRVHTGEKPYKCTYCEYATAQNSTLKIHLRRHHQGTDGVRCLQCKKEFSEPECLTSHSKTEHQVHRQVVFPDTITVPSHTVTTETITLPNHAASTESITSPSHAATAETITLPSHTLAAETIGEPQSPDGVT